MASLRVKLCVKFLKTVAKIDKFAQKYTHGIFQKTQGNQWKAGNSGGLQKAIGSLSRRRQGFESPWGRQFFQVVSKTDFRSSYLETVLETVLQIAPFFRPPASASPGGLLY